MKQERIIIDLIRHGEPEGGHRIRGSTDDELTEQGWTEMQNALLDMGPWELVVTSPLKRCHEFAEHLAKQFTQESQPSLVIDENFRELHLGDWEGREIEEVWENDAELAEQFWKSPTQVTPPNGESFQSMYTRVTQAWDTLVANSTCENILIVTHGGPIRALLCYLLGFPENNINRIDVPFGSVTQIEVVNFNGSIIPRLLMHGYR